jgi:flagellar biosynthesis protein FlhB
MGTDDDMSDKSEKATPYKLQKAKEDGRVSKSTELNTCIVMLVLLGVATALCPSDIKQIKLICTQLLSMATTTMFSIDNIIHLQQTLLLALLPLWLPFALAGLLSIILSTIAQTGFVWSGKPISPDFKRLDIVTGLKRLLSIKSCFDAIKNTLKLALVSILLYWSMQHESGTFLSFTSALPTTFLAQFGHLLTRILLQILALLFALSFLDTLYTRWKFAQDNRMSKQELKDEYRQREGDPKIKAKRRQIQQQLRQKIVSLEQVKTADVVITNPTHLAIALKYERGTMPAPKVVCKAQGELVKHVKLLAARHAIPIIENKSVARALFASSDLNEWIHHNHFPVIAGIFRELYRQKGVT